MVLISNVQLYACLDNPLRRRAGAGRCTTRWASRQAAPTAAACGASPGRAAPSHCTPARPARTWTTGWTPPASSYGAMLCSATKSTHHAQAPIPGPTAPERQAQAPSGRHGDAALQRGQRKSGRQAGVTPRASSSGIPKILNFWCSLEQAGRAAPNRSPVRAIREQTAGHIGVNGSGSHLISL